MKKIYFAPDMEILEAELQQLLAASLPMGDDVVNDANDILAPEMDNSDNSYSFFE